MNHFDRFAVSRRNLDQNVRVCNLNSRIVPLPRVAGRRRAKLGSSHDGLIVLALNSPEPVVRLQVRGSLSVIKTFGTAEPVR